MKTIVEIKAAFEAWWMEDGMQARVSNTYTRHGENHARAAEACFDDYEAGAYDAFAVLALGKSPSIDQLIQRYERRMRGERIDVYSYRLGAQRMANEWLR